MRLRSVVVCAALLLALPARAQLALPRGFRVAHPLPTSRLPRHPLGGGALPDAEEIDRALAATRIDVARARFHADGRGATVCVIDTGADVTHPLLQDADGRTRLRYLVDLDGVPRADETDAAARTLAMAVGAAVWSSTAIDAGAAGPGDPWGHGTAVTSLVARAAPAASLVVVKALRAGSGGYLDEDLMRAAQICVRGADDPTREVLLLSLGGHDGAHDGTEPLEEALAASPALVVAAAGNDSPDGAAPHARIVLSAADASVQVHVPNPGPFALGPLDDGERSVTIVVVTGADAEVALEAPDGTRTSWTAAGATHVVDAATARLAVEAGSAPRPNGAHVVYAVIAGGGVDLPALVGGRYVLHSRGSGVLDAWLADSALAGPLSSPGFVGDHSDHEDTVTIPATSAGVVAVGAVVSASEVYAGSALLSLDGAIPGLPAAFSARGPRRDGFAKPDLLAPGAISVAALSRDVTGDDPHDVTGGSRTRLSATRVGDAQVAVLGTSFAAPFAAATLALALGDGGSGPSRGEADRTLLAVTASRLSPEPWDAQAGFGTLDAERFLALRAATATSSPIDPTMLRATFTRASAAVGDEVELLVRAMRVDGTPVSDAVVEVDGASVAAMNHGLARVTTTVPAIAPLSTPWIARVVVHEGSDLRATTASLRVGPDAATPLLGASGGGGCSVGGASPTTLAVAVIALSVARSRSRSSRRALRRGRPGASRS